MATIDIKQNIGRLLRTLEGNGMKPTSIAKSMGYTTTSQLHSVLEGDSLISTKAIINLIENLKVNPTYLFLGTGEMFLSEENEIDELRKKNQELAHNHNEAVKVVIALNDTIKKLEKRNADLIDLTSAAIKYHKGLAPEETFIELSSETDPVKKNLEIMRMISEMNKELPEEKQKNVVKPG